MGGFGVGGVEDGRGLVQEELSMEGAWCGRGWLWAGLAVRLYEWG